MGSTAALETGLEAAVAADSGTGAVVLDLAETVALDSRITKSIATGIDAAGARGFFVANPPSGSHSMLANHGVDVLGHGPTENENEAP